MLLYFNLTNFTENYSKKLLKIYIKILQIMHKINIMP